MASRSQDDGSNPFHISIKFTKGHSMELIFYLLLLFSVLVPMIVSRKEEDVSAPPFYLEPDDGRRHKFPPEDDK